jgi:hypothetical protein
MRNPHKSCLEHQVARANKEEPSCGYNQWRCYSCIKINPHWQSALWSQINRRHSRAINIAIVHKETQFNVYTHVRSSMEFLPDGSFINSNKVIVRIAGLAIFLAAIISTYTKDTVIPNKIVECYSPLLHSIYYATHWVVCILLSYTNHLKHTHGQKYQSYLKKTHLLVNVILLSSLICDFCTI